MKRNKHTFLFFSGVPAVVDFAAMRDAVKRLGGDPSRINPLCPVDLVIDHSVQVDVSRRYVSLCLGFRDQSVSLTKVLCRVSDTLTEGCISTRMRCEHLVEETVFLDQCSLLLRTLF